MEIRALAGDYEPFLGEDNIITNWLTVSSLKSHRAGSLSPRIVITARNDYNFKRSRKPPKLSSD